MSTSQANPKPINVLSPHEVEELVEAAGESLSGMRNAALVWFLFATGLRISEACALRLHSLEYAANGDVLVNVENGKGGTQGWAMMLGDAWVLARWLRERQALGLGTGDFLFCTITKGNVGSPVCRKYADRMVKRLAARAGITKRVHLHGMRHSHAVRLYQLGAPQSAIQDQLRHTDPETTRRYLRDLGCVDSRSVLAGLSF